MADHEKHLDRVLELPENFAASLSSYFSAIYKFADFKEEPGTADESTRLRDGFRDVATRLNTEAVSAIESRFPSLSLLQVAKKLILYRRDKPKITVEDIAKIGMAFRENQPLDQQQRSHWLYLELEGGMTEGDVRFITFAQDLIKAAQAEQHPGVADGT